MSPEIFLNNKLFLFICCAAFSIFSYYGIGSSYYGEVYFAMSDSDIINNRWNPSTLMLIPEVCG